MRFNTLLSIAQDVSKGEAHVFLVVALTPGKIRLACCDPEARATTRIRFERHTINRTQCTQERDAMEVGIKAMGRDSYKRLSKQRSIVYVLERSC